MYKAKLKFNVFQIWQKLSGIGLEECDDVETYALQIDQTVTDYSLCSEPSSSDATRTLVEISDEAHVFYLLRGIPRNDNWEIFLELIMDQNAMAMLTPNDIVMKLVKKEATIKRENGLGQEALLFTKRNAKGKGRKSGKGDESDEDQGDMKSQPT